MAKIVEVHVTRSEIYSFIEQKYKEAGFTVISVADKMEGMHDDIWFDGIKVEIEVNVPELTD